jgi:hypothetical protein
MAGVIKQAKTSSIKTSPTKIFLPNVCGAKVL